MPHRARRASSQVPKRAGSAEPRGATLERNIYGFLAATIGREIVSGVYPPGSLLPNVQELCQRFGVSRTALREAYSLLTAKALIVARPKVGTWVRPRAEWHMIDPDVLAWHLESDPSEQFVADLFALRQMVEPGAAAAAARLHDPETIAKIDAAFADMERFKDGSGDLIEADLQFHMAILSGSANPFLAALGGLIHTSLQCVFRYSWKGASKMADSRLRQHGVILEAIRDGDPTSAHQRMAHLLAESFEDVRAAFENDRAPPPPVRASRRRAAIPSA
jgi:GntR family transcriptional regulator, galactonate operon transcriptional repressor